MTDNFSVSRAASQRLGMLFFPFFKCVNFINDNEILKANRKLEAKKGIPDGTFFAPVNSTGRGVPPPSTGRQ